MSTLPRHTASAGIVVWALAFSIGCGGKTAAKTEAPIKDPLEIAPGPDLQKTLKVGQPEWRGVSATIQVAGRIEADAARMARVSAPVAGRLVELSAIEGQHVSKGEVLAVVYSTELSSAESDFLKADTQRRLADRAVSRARQLLDAGVIGSAELFRRESELQQTAADVAAARERLRILGITEDSIASLENSRKLSSYTRITSPIAGIVLERTATIGQIVGAADPVFTVADLSSVWLVADVPEQNAGNLRTGKAVEAEFPALPGHKTKGRLSFVSATINPETRTVATRMNVANPQRLYKPAMLATITLMDEAQRRLVIPSAAVVREGNDDCVFVETRPNTYVLRKVAVGEDAEGRRLLLNGIREGERIVTDGAFHLNNERKRQALGGSEA